MNNPNIPEPDLDRLLKRALKDDLPPEAEARMNRQFLRLKRSLGQPESLAEADDWPWHGLFRKEIFAFVSAVFLILGVVMHLSEPQSALAHSIEQLKVIMTITMSLDRAVSMDCTILKPESGGESISYHVRWRAKGDARVDMDAAGRAQTIWISDETISLAASDGSTIRSVPLKTIAAGPAWQPAMEFRTPEIFAKQMEERYGLMQTGDRSDSGSGDFLITGREDGQTVELTVDAKTYLPKTLKKYALDSSRNKGERSCLVEVRFNWNRPMSDALFVPGPLTEKQ
jgi:hypothetical protein